MSHVTQLWMCSLTCRWASLWTLKFADILLFALKYYCTHFAQNYCRCKMRDQRTAEESQRVLCNSKLKSHM